MFLESNRFPTDVSFEHPGGPGYNVDVQVLESGHEQRNSFWPEERGHWDVGYNVRELHKATAVMDFFRAQQGRAHGFRYKDWNDFKSVRRTAHGDSADPISALDQVISVDTTTEDVFQLIKNYRNGFLNTKRTITKPVVSTVLLAIQGITIPANRYDLTSGISVKLLNEGHDTVGKVTLAANIQKTIIGITNAASAVVETSTAHGLSINDSVHFSSVGGMTGINGKRGLITAVGDTTHITVAIDSTGLGTYTTGGQINTRRQATSIQASIAAVTKHALALVTTSAPHGFVAGDVGTFASVGGMTELNAQIATVMEVPSATTFRVNLNSVEYTTYTAGGTFAIAERVTAGFEFDVAVRFDIDQIPMTFTAWEAAGVEVPIVELRV